MLAYTKTITKNEFVRELKAHEAADNVIQGHGYWEYGKGCAVGCSLESISRLKKLEFDFSDHKLYEEHLGIPEWLACLEDTLFENMSSGRAKHWPVEFAEAINVGSNLEKAKTPFIITLLEHTLVSMKKTEFERDKWPDVVKALADSEAAVRQMIEAQKSGDAERIINAASAARSAESAAWSAAWSAESAARSAARSAACDYYADQLLKILRGINAESKT